MKTQSHTLSYTLSHTSFTGWIDRAASFARLLGEGLRLLWHGTRLAWYSIRVVWYWMRMAWYWVCLLWIYSVRAFFAFVFLILLWDFTDLLGIPLIQDLKKDLIQAVETPARLFEKEDPAKVREKALLEASRINRDIIQTHCRHIRRRNGLWNYFCPLCGKKLIPGDHPWWQV